MSEQLKDPVNDQLKVTDNKDDEQLAGLEEFTFEGLKPIPERAAKRRNPFEGYPEKKIKIGVEKGGKGKSDKDIMLNLTHLVALSTAESVFQDPSGMNMTDKKGRQYTIKSSHNRMVMSFLDNQNHDVVFDRDITLPDGTKVERYALIPDATIRAQICFKVDNKTGKTKVDSRYLMGDVDQSSRLMEVFTIVMNNKLKAERSALKFDREQESTALDTR